MVDRELAAGAALLVALGRLTDRQRHAFIARHWRGLSQGQVALELGVTHSRVQQLEHKAQVRLAMLLAPYREALRDLEAA